MAIRVEDADGARTILIDRPDKANALTGDMLDALHEAAASAQASGARALLLTGRGKVFSAGADLDAARNGLATSDKWGKASDAIAAFPGLSIAVLNGTCAGGATGLMLACDLRVATPGASFFYPVMKLGYLPQPADVPRLVALVGPARAKLILMGGARLSASEAFGIGLVDRVADDSMAEAQTLVSASLGAPEGHETAIKELIAQEGRNHSAEE